MAGVQHPSDEDGVNQIVRDLKELRATAGAPSYAEIVRRVTAARQARGIPEALARPARTTVYDAFREGRARLDAELVGDIADALQGDAASFRRRCLTARLATEPTARVDPARETEDPPAETLTPATEPATSPIAETTVETGPRPDPGSRVRYRIGVAIASLAINLLGYVAVEVLGIPLFLDTTGTGIAAIALGPWYGVGVAIATHAMGLAVHGTVTIPFTLVNITVALVWGYGVRRFRLGDSIGRYLALTIGVGAASTAVAVPIILTVFAGELGRDGFVVLTMTESGVPLGLSIAASNLIMSVADRLICGFFILTAVAASSQYLPVPGGRLFHLLGSQRASSLPTHGPMVVDEPSGHPPR